MDHIDILRRSLHLTWRSEALWVFGALLALTSGGSFNFPRGGQAQWRLTHQDLSTLSENWGILLLGVLCLAAILIVLAVTLRYIAQTGLYRLIDEKLLYDRTPTVRQGFTLGLDRRALRLLGIDLIIDIPLSIFALSVLALALSPLLLLLVDSPGVKIVSIVLTIGLVLIALLILFIVGGTVGIWRQLVARQAVLDDQSWSESLRRGYDLFVAQWQDILLMALLMWGIAIGWGLVTVPVIVLLGAIAVAAGGIPAWLVMGLTGSRWAAWLVGVPIGATVFLIPLLILQGAYQAFHAAVWTITYRELVPASESLEE